MKERDKRGSHVGMILSFVIFITFIVFLYSVFRPAINTGENKKSILNDVEIEILKQISVNLSTATIQITKNNNPNDKCIQFEGFLSNVYTSGIKDYTYKLKVKDDSSVPQNAFSAQTGTALTVDRLDNSKTFFKVYFSPEFPNVGEKIGTSISSGNFNVGSITTDNFPFESKITYLANYYNTNHDKLKAELKVTPGNDFGFVFTKSDGTSMPPVGTPPKTANVFTDEVPIQYIDSDANIKSGFINIKVW